MSNFTSVLANSVNNDGAVDAGVITVNSLSSELILASGDGMNVTDNGSDTITIESTVAANNVGTGDGEVYKSNTAGNLNLRTLKAGTNVTIATGTNEVTINATGGGGGADLSAVAEDYLPTTNNAYDLGFTDGITPKSIRNLVLGSYVVDTSGNAMIGADRTLRATGGAGAFDWSTGDLVGVDPGSGKPQVKNIADPTSDQDAATKKYVDDNAGGGGTLPDAFILAAGPHTAPTLLTNANSFFIVGDGNNETNPSVRLPESVNYPEGGVIRITSNVTLKSLRVYAPNSSNYSIVGLGPFVSTSSSTEYLEVPPNGTLEITNAPAVLTLLGFSNSSYWVANAVQGITSFSGIPVIISTPTYSIATAYAYPEFVADTNAVSGNIAITMPVPIQGYEILILKNGGLDVVSIYQNDGITLIDTLTTDVEIIRLKCILSGYWQVV